MAELNTEKFEEAEIISQTPEATETTENATTELNQPEKNNSSDLLNRLNKVTERKEPGTIAPNQSTKASSFWSSSNDDFEAEKKQPETTTTEKKEVTTEQKEKSLNDTSFHNSGQNMTFFIETLTEGLGRFAISKKFKKRFSEPEKNALRAGLLDLPKSKLNDDQKQLIEKYNKLNSVREEKIKYLPFDEDESRIMEDAWFRYFKQKNKEMPPEWAVAMAVISTVGSRAIDIAID